MTPDRAALILAFCPSMADFQRAGPIVNVQLGMKPTDVGPRTIVLTYELKMFLDGLTTLNKRIGDQPAPEPLRHYEIHCEGMVVQQNTY